MTIEHIRISRTARDQLITLKRRTGIMHWNVLCRWALCRSLAEPAPPPAIRLTARQQCRDDLACVRRRPETTSCGRSSATAAIWTACRWTRRR